MRVHRLWLAGLAALLLPTAAAAQEDEGPQMFFVHQEVVKPSMIAEYEAAAADWMKLLSGSTEAKGKIAYYAYSGPQIGFVYVVPIDDFSHFSEMGDAFDAVADEVGAPWEEAGNRSDMAADHFESGFYVHRPDLSYEPANPRLGDDEVKMVHWDFWYALPDKTDDLEAVAKEFVELYTSESLDTGWNVYQAITGGDLPLYVVAVQARDEADFYANEARLNELVGAEAQKLGMKALKAARRVEPFIGWYRPDLSYPQATEMATEGGE
ncbi:MAG: hypothetical protein P8Y10_01700 [Gemmatimonadales bacterium]|jgi:hypothetical protein